MYNATGFSESAPPMSDLKLEKINSFVYSIPRPYLALGIVAIDILVLYVDFATGPGVPLTIFYLAMIYLSLKYIGSRFSYTFIFFTVLAKTYIKSLSYADTTLLLSMWRFISIYLLYSMFCYLLNAQMARRKEAETALDELSKLHGSIIAETDSGVMVFQSDGECMLANEAAATILGGTRDTLLQTNFRRISSWPGSGMLKAAEIALGSGETQKINSPMRTSYGKDIWCVASLGRIDRKDAPPYLLVVFADMSAYKEAERKIINISEETQQRIGRELHDDLGQHLTGIAFMSEVLFQSLKSHGHENMGDALKITSLVNEAISKTRKLAQGLYPVEMKESGLRGMLEHLASNVGEIHQTECEFICEEECKVNNDSVTVVNLFRIAQEAINNAIRHSGATKITLKMTSTPAATTLEIADNGCGIGSSGEWDAKAGLGMHTMQYRASLLGAALSAAGGADGGTCISVKLPIQSNRMSGYAK